jgi:hypothetical protein
VQKAKKQGVFEGDRAGQAEGGKDYEETAVTWPCGPTTHGSGSKGKQKKPKKKKLLNFS